MRILNVLEVLVIAFVQILECILEIILHIASMVLLIPMVLIMGKDKTLKVFGYDELKDKE